LKPGGPDGRADVAVFIDFENIYISVRNRHDVNPNFELIMDQCGEYGRVTIARAYADWYRYPRVTNALYANSIEPMYVPTYYYDRDEGRTGKAIKNAVDMYLCIDMMKTLFSYPNIVTYVLVTGDRDFIPLLNTIRQQGKHTVVIGVADATASHLAQAADDFVFYDQLLGRQDDIQVAVQDPYDALAKAVQTARERGTVSTLATLKLLMREHLPDFDESQYADPQGKPFSKFKDFVREAERRGFVQVFTSGSVNEVFLPNEDPYKVSRFVSESAPEPEEREPERPSRDGLSSLGQKEWAVFEEAMRQFDDAVLFIQIYDLLRGLRNKEIMDLSNQDIKAMIKHAINEGMLLRTTRGSHAYYRLNPDRPFVLADGDARS
jgi:uncharacterized protein (TIGR00288 family)